MPGPSVGCGGGGDEGQRRETAQQQQQQQQGTRKRRQRAAGDGDRNLMASGCYMERCYAESRLRIHDNDDELLGGGDERFSSFLLDHLLL
jgi:hypothetical protein